ncbi:MAG: hypothetical protein JWN43_3270 [Gammaproteobacteria bacterium]|nr:hypothetical protein [Gammaproteobacteria bacterium]
MQQPNPSEEVNIRSRRFLLARGTAICGRCRAPTRSFALLVPPGHEVLEPDDEARDEELPAGTWHVAADSALLFYVSYLPDAIQRRVGELTQCYRPATGTGGLDAHWTNHCEHCGSPLDDHELFCEPEGAFVPTTESDARLIRLLPIDEAFEATAAGYSYDPQFFGAMGKA